MQFIQDTMYQLVTELSFLEDMTKQPGLLFSWPRVYTYGSYIPKQIMIHWQ